MLLYSIFPQGTGTSNNSHGDLSVEISASCRADLTDNGGLIVSRQVHAISVAQPVQSWTVIREHSDFVTLGNALSSVIRGIPSCPSAPTFDACNGSSSDADEIVKVRNAAQNWLVNLLLFPGARESPALRQFLCYGANLVPPQYQGMNWITFPPSLQSQSNSDSDSSSNSNHHSNGRQHSREVAEELEMDEMFGYGDGPADEDVYDDDEVDYEDDDIDYFSATERYQPTEEPVTQDDVMEFQNNADDVEMIEDVGSLAQSLGASHLGRSLQLQAELAVGKMNHAVSGTVLPQRSLNFGGIVPSTSNGQKFVGGIGNAVENASLECEAKVQGLSDSFYQKKPVSAPRLDSFKMIKVVGKGSFGKMFFIYIFVSLK